MALLHIILKEKGKCYPVIPANIIRIEASGNFVNVFLADGKVFIAQTGIIGLWEQRLKPSGLFARIHRSHLIKCEAVEYFSRAYGVLLKDKKTSLPLSPNGYIALWDYFSNLNASINNK